MAAYKGSLRRFEILSRFVLYGISVILSIFLILLGDTILGDMSKWFREPQPQRFQDQSELAKLELRRKDVQRRISAFEEQNEMLARSRDAARRRHDSEKQSLSAWIEARRATGSPKEDAQVLERAKALEIYRKAGDAWQEKIDSLDGDIRQARREDSELEAEQSRLHEQGRKRHERAMQFYALKIFLIRLALIMPILALGIYLFVRHRRSKYRALVWGYVLFSLYAFFIGLVPYLPSFGGYIRYSVGSILTALGGYYLIRELKNYTERKAAELRESSSERALKIAHDTALKAYRSHCCPSCEHDFLLNKWEPPSKISKETVRENEAPDFCQHCGLRLFAQCPACGHRNFSHFPFCAGCGIPLHAAKTD